MTDYHLLPPDHSTLKSAKAAVAGLSGGMEQRAANACARVHDPPLLMMDEPFGALDAPTRQQMRLDLERIWLTTKKTVLFTAHSIDDALLLSYCFVNMTPRPGRLDTILNIDLDRPRGIAAHREPAFAEAFDEISKISLAFGALRQDPRWPVPASISQLFSPK